MMEVPQQRAAMLKVARGDKNKKDMTFGMVKPTAVYGYRWSTVPSSENT